MADTVQVSLRLPSDGRCRCSGSHESGLTMRPPVAVLFARSDSVYKTIARCDVFDLERDALTWPGGSPLIAHPPCRSWARLRHFAKPLPGERSLAIHAVEQVRRYGGVLEHPIGSQLWPLAGLPSPGAPRDAFGGWTLPIRQHWFGHRADKSTLLYVVGCEPPAIPAFPLRLDRPTHVVGLYSGRDRATARPSISKAEREHTPVDLAIWLVELASRCRVPS